jgi:bla regulator protein BlaR1
MIAAWMAYCIAIGLAIAVAGGATERALHLTGRPTRWAWSVALLGTFLLPLGAILRPQAFGTFTVPLTAPAPRAAGGAIPGRTQGAVAPAPPAWRGPTWTDLDGVLRWGWGLSSVVLLVVLGAAAARLAALRRGWRPTFVDGRLVLVADDVGPAVAGLWPPRIVIPGWALGLPECQQRLMLAHEEEHLQARDPWLLAGGAAALVLTPWNPVAWWLVRRLRLAVEMDCDARVLGRGHSTRDYGELMLQVGQHRAHLPLTATALGEPQSLLERRIRRMVARPPRWRWLGATAAAAFAAAALVAACEAPRPTAPQRPPQATGQVVPTESMGDALLFVLSAPSELYPRLLRQAGIQGRVRVRAVVDSNGRAEPQSVQVIATPHPGFEQVARNLVLQARFHQGRFRERAVRVVIEFRLDARAGG